jgi:hypothetical protein
MSSECLQVEMAREGVKEGVEGAFIPPHPKYSRYRFKTRNIRGKPGYSGLPRSAPKKRFP